MKISKCPKCGSENTILYFVNRSGYIAECEDCGNSDGPFRTKVGSMFVWGKENKIKKVFLLLSILGLISIVSLIWFIIISLF